MQQWICPVCHQERIGVRKRCYECTGAKNQSAEVREKIRQIRLAAPPRSAETRQRLADAALHHPNRFGLGAFIRGKPSPRAKPVGSTRPENGHTKVKCPDGKWRYRARVIWTEANGPIPRGLLIHHINEDPNDDRLENLQLVTRSEHMRLHNPGLATQFPVNSRTVA